MAQVFKTGDIVSLKSDSPDMTVQGYESIITPTGDVQESETSVMVSWFDSTGKLQHAKFHQDSLIIDE